MTAAIHAPHSSPQHLQAASHLVPPLHHFIAQMRVEHQQSVADYARVPDNRRSYVGPDTSAVRKMGYEYEGRVIEDESRKQEEYLDQIGRHLEVLKAGALVGGSAWCWVTEFGDSSRECAADKAQTP
jgi:hypothetical protein